MMDEKRLWELIALKAAQEAGPEELAELENLLVRFPEANFTMEAMDAYWPGKSAKTEQQELEAALEKHMLRLNAEQDIHQPRSQVFRIDTDPKPSEDLSMVNTLKADGVNVDEGRDDAVKNAETEVSDMRINPWWKKIAVAASVISILGVGFLFLNTNKNEPTAIAEIKTITTSNGSKNHFTLPDGSRVWLNAGSTLSYPLSFMNDSIRRVTLSGEAYFEVTHDEQHPFLIHTEQMEIRDIGTAFNVKAYPGDELTEATLIEGSIEVKLPKSDRGTVLAQPNEKLTVVTKNGKTMIAQSAGAKQVKIIETAELELLKSKVAENPVDSLLAETAWLEDKLVFSNESFESLAKKMERWYDVTIQFGSESIKQKRFTGTFSKETVSQALQEIQIMKPFHFRIENNVILITE